MAIIDVVKWNGNPNLLAWKFPSSELSTFTQLIVNESQEAFLVSGGVYEGPFRSGRHTLSTENLPLLRGLIKLPFGGQTPFSAEVWYVNRVTNLDIKWGTPDPIQVQDPKFGILIPVRSFGQYGIRVKDSKRFLLKLVGTLPGFDAQTLSEYFRGVFITRIKTLIATTIVKQGVSILEISTELEALSKALHEAMASDVEEYGVELSQFNVHSISVDENNSGVAKLREALSRRAEMSILGFNYHQERSFDILQTAAGNEGTAGAAMGVGIGAGLGVGLGTSMSQMMGNMAVPPVGTGGTGAPVTPQSPGGAVGPVGNLELSSAERISLLREFAALRDSGVLTEEEFAREKARILGQ